MQRTDEHAENPLSKIQEISPTQRGIAGVPTFPEEKANKTT